jgi:MinD superfamily P-loop ATPase
MSHARLTPGMENSGKLVTLVRQNASKLAEKEGKNLILVDGSPGIGCPVIASIANIDAAIVVVEPTLSSIHDLKRALELLEYFKIVPMVVVNKYDINEKNTADLETYCNRHEITLLGKIPFDPTITKSMVQGIPVVDYDSKAISSIAIKIVWNRFREQFLI